MITINKAINGISLNGLETLLDKDNKPMKFNSKKLAIEFLKDNGYSELSDDIIEDVFTFKQENI